MRFGGFRVQGKSEEAADQLLRDARAVEAAGAFSIVLESIPRELAARHHGEANEFPTIGIGAGPDCDGQILVIHDLLGYELRPQTEIRAALCRRSGEIDLARGGGVLPRRATGKRSLPTKSRITSARRTAAPAQILRRRK
jgi:hypothetical protein